MLHWPTRWHGSSDLVGCDSARMRHTSASCVCAWPALYVILTLSGTPLGPILTDLAKSAILLKRVPVSCRIWHPNDQNDHFGHFGVSRRPVMLTLLTMTPNTDGAKTTFWPLFDHFFHQKWGHFWPLYFGHLLQKKGHFRRKRVSKIALFLQKNHSFFITFLQK